MTDPERDLWYGTSGPHDAEIVIVGESWGAEEASAKRPFVGSSGVELDRMLDECGIDRRKCLTTNIIAERPPQNETFRFFHPKDIKAPRIAGLSPTSFVESELRRLYRQLTYSRRKLVIAAGNWSLWALSMRTGAGILSESSGRKIPKELQTWAPSGIMDWRGSMWYVEPHDAFADGSQQKEELHRTKLLPIIHPAAILRAWYLRAPTIHDLKSRVPLALSSNWRPNPPPITLSPPSFSDATNRLRYWLDQAQRGTRVILANDIETIRKTFISVMGFADSTNFAMCIPFVRRDNPDGSFDSYWPPQEEAEIVYLIRKVLTHPKIEIIGQNYIYDLQFIQHWLGITPHLAFDTMLAQNVIFPGTPKALEYLSSLYCQYHWYWKEDHKDWDRLGELQRLMDYNCIDVLRTWEIADAERKYIRSIGQEAQMEFKMQTNDLCLRMMNRGILIDKAKRGAMIYDLEAARAGYYSELLRIIPQEMVKPGHKVLWYRSDSQIKTLFYDVLGFKPILHRKTGRPTSGKEALMALQKRYPEFTGLFSRLDIAGSVDNSLGVAQTPSDPDGRMRCSYNPGGTETHRLSSSENVWGRGTNLQNLTKGEEDD
jgi:uracil-DNA glycosylase